MTEPSYSFRANALAPERTYRLGADALYRTTGRKEERIPYGDICEVRLYRQFMRGESALNKKIMWRCHLQRRTGGRVVLSPRHSLRFEGWEDRSSSYAAFINALLAQLRSCNPDLTVITQPHWTLRLRRAVRRSLMPIQGRILAMLLELIRNWDPDRTARAAGRLMRAVGPWLRGHRVARANLKAAFPRKSEREIERMLQGVWDNYGRMMAEYAFLEQLWDYDPAGRAGRIVVDPATAARLAQGRQDGRPVLLFGAHIANWELPPALGPVFGHKSAMVYRPFDYGVVAEQLLEARRRIMGLLIPTHPRGALRMVDALRQGYSVGMLVDEHFARGIDVLFFGRKCKVNPTLAWFARRLELPIYGGRAIRLPDGRYRLEMTDELELPRDQEGKVDIAATMQMITWIIEGWVREYPEQWRWMLRRWR